MTCTPIPCITHGANACHKATRNAQTHKRIKMHKNKRNVTKTCKNIQGVKQQWRSKKGGQQNEANTRGPRRSKGSLKVGPTSQNETEVRRNETHTTQFM
uniref:Uncharacterized protein n=1 Tax=Siphoviridae sp. ctQ091 TaxID=2825490 RepID=A0A8S5NV07_9CAUD|nr:MAG TPA: hypothetical protein [Siphoviridae sp. ctQ091]